MKTLDQGRLEIQRAATVTPCLHHWKMVGEVVSGAFKSLCPEGNHASLAIDVRDMRDSFGIEGFSYQLQAYLHGLVTLTRPN